MKHIIVIGKTGQLARALAARAKAHNVKIKSYSRRDCDFSAPDDVIVKFAYDIPECDGIIIAAAYTQVDKAEDERDIAFRVNSAMPRIIAEVCASREIPLIHISTDYVFPGDGDRPLLPSDTTIPINTYGASKLAGEKAVLFSGARAAILRTSWVFDGTGINFMTTMLRLAKTRDTLNVVADQIGRPTYAGHLADASFVALNKMIDDPDFDGGIYHVSGTGPPISWADFADAIFTVAVEQIPHTMKVGRIPTSDYPTPAKRPSYSVLDTTEFETTFNHTLPNWQDGLADAYTEVEE
ncbi:MAG: dTDP-4-dehydrorhamnose reductase [Hellea sp.]|nr:dTDP-4-dehydrorhamnose reductase [Hellea sp.]